MRYRLGQSVAFAFTSVTSLLNGHTIEGTGVIATAPTTWEPK